MVKRRLLPRYITEHIELRRELRELRRKYGKPEMTEKEAVGTILQIVHEQEKKKKQRINAAIHIRGVGIFGVIGEVSPNYLKRLEKASEDGAILALNGLIHDVESILGLQVAATAGTLAMIGKVTGHNTMGNLFTYLSTAGLGAWAKDAALGAYLKRRAHKEVYEVARQIMEDIRDNLSPEEREQMIKAALAIENSISPVNKALGRAILHAVAAKQVRKREARA